MPAARPLTVELQAPDESEADVEETGVPLVAVPENTSTVTEGSSPCGFPVPDTDQLADRRQRL